MGHNTARQHHIRNRKVTDKELHIRKDGEHGVWLDEDPRATFRRLFGQAVAEYNERQSRPDRRIGSYYNAVCKDAKKHPVYEVIVGVYPKDGELSHEEKKAILKEYVDGWKKANPNLELCGVYWHADEAGEPHIHVDYVPWADGYKNGPERQAGLVRALEAQGFQKQGRQTAQMQWTQAENARLESICRGHGLQVTHPMRGEQSKHLSTKAYKFHMAQLAELRRVLQEGKRQLDGMEFSLLDMELKLDTSKAQLRQTAEQLSQMAEELRRAVDTVEQFPNASDIFQWAESKYLQSQGKTILEAYCDSQNLDYQYWVKACGLTPNPYGNFGQNRTR